MPGTNAIFQQHLAALNARTNAAGRGQTPVQEGGQTPVTGLQKTHGANNAPAGYIAMALVVGGLVAYAIWMWLAGEKIKDGAKKLLPNLQVILTATASVVVGLLIAKLFVFNLAKDMAKSGNGLVMGLYRYLVHPLALVLGFV